MMAVVPVLPLRAAAFRKVALEAVLGWRAAPVKAMAAVLALVKCTACAAPAINVDGVCRVCDLACQNNGHCTFSQTGQFCTCPAGFGGALCQTSQAFDVVTETKTSANSTVKRVHFYQQAVCGRYPGGQACWRDSCRCGSVSGNRVPSRRRPLRACDRPSQGWSADFGWVSSLTDVLLQCHHS